MNWPIVEDLRLSPDGEHIAGVVHTRDRGGVIVYDVDTLTPRLLSGAPLLAETTEVRWFDDRLLVVYSDCCKEKLVDVNTQEQIDAGDSFISKLAPDADGHERFLYEKGARLYRYDMVTKKRVELNRSPPERRVLAWTYDRNGEARVVTTIDSAIFSDDTRVTHWYRESPELAWQKLASFDYLADFWEPIAFREDQQSIVVSSRQGRDTRAYFRYDLKERKVAEMIAGHPTQDMSASFATTPKYAITHGMKTEIVWFSSEGEALQRGIDLALPDRINLVQGNINKRVLVYSYNDRDPGRWLLLDIPSGAMRLVTSRKPEIDIEKMLPKQIVTYTARDGLSIPAYLTAVPGTGPGPAIVYIHGGPAVRDAWDWDPEVQMLAARGYTVFQPQFRGSGGFGKRYMEAGYGQWGAAMQDDITDGAAWLVANGYADPDRICIYGASYGGYAALWGMVKTPRLYRCGASFAGVSDLRDMFKDRNDINASATARLARDRMFGASAENRQTLDDVSPLKSAARFRAPVLIAHGEWDFRVRIDQSEKMVDALQDKGKDVEWLVLRKEGHGIFLESNQKRYFEALFKFFDKHLGRQPFAVGKTK
ncbi:MAG: alpha/beta fold hydrolase [Massilia sp.]